MRMFDVRENLIINLDNIDFIRFDKINHKKKVVVGINGHTMIIPEARHEEFFTECCAMGMKPTSQFVAI